MKKSNLYLLGLLSLAALHLPLVGQTTVPGTATSMIVTMEPKRGKEIPGVDAADVAVQQNKEKARVVSLVPAGQNGSGMQLLLLFDDSAQSSFDSELQVLRQFVTSLPASTEVAIGYMRNGGNQMATNFTHDHEAAAKTIRVAMGSGGADVSPYDSLSEAVKQWPAGAERREVIMISSGIEGLGGGYTSDNPYVNRAVADAQKAGILVHTIYNPSVGHFGHAMWRENWGQNFLSQLSDETGGESYMIGFGAPVSFQPFLQQIREQMQHQFVLTFEARPEKKSELQAVKVRILEKDASIAAADRVFVRAGM